jgi:hypothetical protein
MSLAVITGDCYPQYWAQCQYETSCLRDKPAAEPDGDRVRTTTRAELRKQVFHVRLHSVGSNKQTPTDLGIRHAFCDQCQNLQLSGRWSAHVSEPSSDQLDQRARPARGYSLKGLRVNLVARR